MEIERKFLLRSQPVGMVLIGSTTDKQYYFSVNPEVRIRKKVDVNGRAEYRLTFKGEGSLVRKEQEISIAADDFDGLVDIINECYNADPIRKEYKVYALPDGKRVEVSTVDSTFTYCEVEFNTVHEANTWKIPDELLPYVIEEVTDKPEYKMKNYWKRTRLENRV